MSNLLKDPRVAAHIEQAVNKAVLAERKRCHQFVAGEVGDAHKALNRAIKDSSEILKATMGEFKAAMADLKTEIKTPTPIKTPAPLEMGTDQPK